jgi:hypothetical protein
LKVNVVDLNDSMILKVLLSDGSLTLPASMRRPPSVNENLSRVLWGIAQGGFALLRGEPPFLRRGGNPPRPGFPL